MQKKSTLTTARWVVACRQGTETKGRITKGFEQTWGWKMLHYLDCSDGFHSVYMCQNLANCKHVQFTVCQLYLNKAVKILLNWKIQSPYNHNSSIALRVGMAKKLNHTNHPLG